MLKTAAIVFGIALLGSGILGFVPAATPNDHLLGLFHVNTLHNIIHIISGAIALFAGLNSERASRIYFQVFGVIYALVAVLGFVSGDQPLLGVVANNQADIWLHLAIAAIALVLGFAVRESRIPTTA